MNKYLKNRMGEKGLRVVEWKSAIACFGIALTFALVVGCSGSGEKAATSNALAEKQEDTIRVAMVQPVPEVDQEKSLEIGESYCREAQERDADIVVFPEMFSLGYYTKVNFEDEAEVNAWKALAVTSDGKYVRHFQALAKELDLAILITYLERRGDELRNSATLIDRHGGQVYTYSKFHTCVFFKMEGSLTRGDQFFVGKLDTEAGTVSIGTMICYDREFPESARMLMLQGAELILTPNACNLRDLRINQFQTRAWENSVAVAMANYAEGQGNGNSCAFNADGERLLLAGPGEGVYYADVDLKELREIREKTFWGDAWRHPGDYQQLVSPEIRESFRRVDSFGRENSRK